MNLIRGQRNLETYSNDSVKGKNRAMIETGNVNRVVKFLETNCSRVKDLHKLHRVRSSHTQVLQSFNIRMDYELSS